MLGSRLFLMPIVLAMCGTPDSCTSVVSLRPLGEEQDLVRPTGLPGAWERIAVEKDGSRSTETLTFTEHGETDYDLAYTMTDPEGLVSAHFTGQVVSVKGSLFLDLQADRRASSSCNCRDRHSELAELSQAPAHMVLRIRIDGDTLHLDYLSGRWLASLSDWERDKYGVLVKDYFVLTGLTRDLQPLLALASEEDGFEEYGQYTRARQCCGS